MPPLRSPILTPPTSLIVYGWNTGSSHGSCRQLWQTKSPAKRPRLSAFALGWCFGLGHFVPGLYWIALSLLTDPERFAWLVPFCVLGVPAGLAVFPAAAILLLHMSVAPAYATGGREASWRLTLKMIARLRRACRTLKGVRRLEILYGRRGAAIRQ